MGPCLKLKIDITACNIKYYLIQKLSIKQNEIGHMCASLIDDEWHGLGSLVWIAKWEDDL